MIEALPGIWDGRGNSIKEMIAPEILIKFIAHTLRYHIIIFVYLYTCYLLKYLYFRQLSFDE